MSAESRPFLDVSGAFQAWARQEKVTFTGDSEALQDLAGQIKVKLPDNPRLLLVGKDEVPHYEGISAALTRPQRYVPTVHSEADIVVRWAPDRWDNAENHESRLTRAVTTSLLDIKHYEQRWAGARWGGAVLLGGGAAAGIGQRIVENDALHWGGLIVAAAGLGYLAFRQTVPPKAPEHINGNAPIRVTKIAAP